MKPMGPLNQERFNRRVLFKIGLGLGGPALGVGLVTYTLGPQEELVWRKLYRSWTKGWTPRSERLLSELLGVLSVIREDKRSELKLVFKLLSFAPTCFFLTGYFNPWESEKKVLDLIHRWQFSADESQKKLFTGLSGIINSSFYGDPQRWQEIAYPGVFEFSVNEGAL